MKFAQRARFKTFLSNPSVTIVGSTPKVPNAALHTNFGPNLVQMAQFAPRSVVSYFP